MLFVYVMRKLTGLLILLFIKEYIKSIINNAGERQRKSFLKRKKNYPKKVKKIPLRMAYQWYSSRQTPPLRDKPPLVLAQFRREAAKFFGLLKIINILAKFRAFYLTQPPPL